MVLVAGRFSPICTPVTTQFDLPTLTSRPSTSPELKNRATDALLNLAADVGADVAIALDPDADWCAVGIPDSAAGDAVRQRNRWLPGDFCLRRLSAEEARGPRTLVAPVDRVVAAAGRHAADHGARHVETLTGFSRLARADDGVAGLTLVYAYEEAIGHCNRPCRQARQGWHQRGCRVL